MSETEAPAETLSISELASLADVTPRTIRYYTSEGLLPPPQTQGKYARYTADYVQRLRLIARLKGAYLPLNEIRDRITSLSAQEVEAMLLELGEPQLAAQAIAESASDYIASILDQQKRTLQPERQAETMSIGVAAPMAAPPAPSAPAPAPAVAPPAPSAPAAKAAPGFLRRLIAPRPSAKSDTEEQREAWQRITIAPGVELHVRSDIQETAQKQIQKLIEHARSIFRS